MTSARPRSLAPAETRYLERDLGISTRPPRVADGATPPVPETLLLQRWRRLGAQRRDGATYQGCRLPPLLWRQVDAALTRRPDLLSLPADEVAALLPRIRASSKAAVGSGPPVPPVSPLTLRALLRFLARGDRLTRIIEAHRQDDRRGVAHLLLYRVRNGRVSAFRFVAAKGATERVSAAQVAEIELLQGLGLQAGIVRLQADRGSTTDVTFTPEELEMMERSVDAEMERWARSLILVVGGEVRKLNEEEVQRAIGRPARRGARGRTR